MENNLQNSIVIKMNSLNRSFFIFIFIVLNNCAGQEFKEKSIQGSWYNFSNGNSEDISYSETFFGKNYFQSYNNSAGLMPSHRYILNKNKIHLLGKENEISDFHSTYELNKNILKIISNKNIITYLKRITDTLAIEDFLEGKINEYQYWKAFTRRRLYWEKHGAQNVPKKDF